MMCHFHIDKIDAALSCGDFQSIMEMIQCTNFNKLFNDSDRTDEQCVDTGAANSPNLRSPQLEAYLKILHAKLMHNLQKEIDNYLLNECCIVVNNFTRENQ